MPLIASDCLLEAGVGEPGALIASKCLYMPLIASSRQVLENLEPVVRRAVVSKSAAKMLSVLQMIDPPELTAEEAEAQAAAIAAKPAIGSRWKKV